MLPAGNIPWPQNHKSDNGKVLKLIYVLLFVLQWFFWHTLMGGKNLAVDSLVTESWQRWKDEDYLATIQKLLQLEQILFMNLLFKAEIT